MVILGRRHGVNRTDDPVVIAGPSHSHVELMAQFKRDFCQSREHPDFEEVWLCSMVDDKRVKLIRKESPKVEIKKEKRK
jgi:hypothetical protein